MSGSRLGHPAHKWARRDVWGCGGGRGGGGEWKPPREEGRKSVGGIKEEKEKEGGTIRGAELGEEER